MQTVNPTVSLREVAPKFNLYPFQALLGGFINEALQDAKKAVAHGNTILLPVFVVWVVLALTLRRDLDTTAVIDWLLSGLRWTELNLALHTIADGALSRARVRLGWRVFELLLQKFTASWTDLEEKITAREIVRHYHQRWEIEIAYDEIKTQQAATLRGQTPTVLRSKRPDLVRQELYALVISYNAVRQLMRQAAALEEKEVTNLSFGDCLQELLDAIPLLSCPGARRRAQAYLLARLAWCEIDRPRRPRSNPRVVKVKLAKFRRKVGVGQGFSYDFEQDLVIGPARSNAGAGEVLRFPAAAPGQRTAWPGALGSVATAKPAAGAKAQKKAA